MACRYWAIRKEKASKDTCLQVMLSMNEAQQLQATRHLICRQAIASTDNINMVRQIEVFSVRTAQTTA